MARRRNASRLVAHAAIILVTVTAMATARSVAGASARKSRPAATAKSAAHPRQAVAHSASVVGEQSIPSGAIGALSLNAPIVGMASTPSGQGSWRVAADGGIFASGDARFFGSVGHHRLNRPIAGMAATPTGRGYWLVATDGGIFSYGDAHFYGSTGGRRLNQPIVAMASTRSGHGYWLIARDGGVFTFGDAQFYGSTGALHLNQPIVGATATASGHGYWFVAADGGIFSFGDAGFQGSTAASHLAVRIVGMAATRNGYLLLGANGHVFNFGGAKNYGSAPNTCSGAPAVAIATSPRALGYWIAFANAKAYALSPVSSAPRCAPAKKPAIGAAAADLFVRMNDERRARGLAPLVWNTTLAAYASSWSRTMGSSNLHHSDIGQLLGVFDYVGENIATGSAGVPASALHLAWMHSQDHRDNILSPGFLSAGVGVYCAPDGSIWATTEFGRPMSAGSPPPYSANTPPDPVARTDAGSAGC